MAFQRKATLAGLTLPIEDHEYTIPPVDADLGLFLTELSATMIAAEEATDRGEELVVAPEQAERLRAMAEPLQNADGITRLISADVFDQMRANGVPWTMIQLAASTAMIWTVNGLEAAEKHWNRGGRPAPKAPTDRAKKKTSAKKK